MPAATKNSTKNGAPAKRRRTTRDHSEVITVPDTIVDPDAAYDDVAMLEDAETAAGPSGPIVVPPFLLRRSGVYQLSRPRVASPTVSSVTEETDSADAADVSDASDDDAAAPFPPLLGFEELRVDVDGLMPTMTISGTIRRIFGGRLTWIARVTKDPATGRWSGPISYRNGTNSLRPQANVSVKLSGGPFLPSTKKATATFSGGSGAPVTLNYTFKTSAFRKVAFEYDTVSDATAVTAHNPTSHPNHEPSVPNTALTLESAYARLGFQVTKSGGDSVDPHRSCGREHHLVRPGDARRDAGALVELGRRPAVGAVGPIRPPA